MAGVVSILLREISAGFVAPDTQRQRGISGSEPSRLSVRCFSTETRIKCFGRAALWKFRVYWSLIGPFSGLIRKAILEQVKTEAEAILKGAS
jgi:hypothetical protein